jgi:hypothetical protein
VTTRLSSPPFADDEPAYEPDFFEIRRTGDGRFVVSGWNGPLELEKYAFPSFHEAYRYCRDWVDQHAIDVRFR